MTPDSSVLISRLLQCPQLCQARLLQDTQCPPYRGLYRTWQQGTPDGQQPPQHLLQVVCRGMPPMTYFPVKGFSWPTGGWISSKFHTDICHLGPNPQPLHHIFSTLQVLIGYLWNEIYSRDEKIYWCVGWSQCASVVPAHSLLAVLHF